MGRAVANGDGCWCSVGPTQTRRRATPHTATMSRRTVTPTPTTPRPKQGCGGAATTVCHTTHTHARTHTRRRYNRHQQRPHAGNTPITGESGTQGQAGRSRSAMIGRLGRGLVRRGPKRPITPTGRPPCSPAALGTHTAAHTTHGRRRRRSRRGARSTHTPSTWVRAGACHHWQAANAGARTATPPRPASHHPYSDGHTPLQRAPAAVQEYPPARG